MTFGTVEYFENYMVDAIKKGGEDRYESLYRVSYALFDLVCEGTFSDSKKTQMQQLLNLKQAGNHIEKRLVSRWEDVL